MTQPLESTIQRDIRLATSRRGLRLFRNQVGVYQIVQHDGTTRTLTTGLCVGSSDLVGWTPTLITPAMVGRRVALFTAIEVKRPGLGRLTPEQARFLQVVREAGGVAILGTSAEQVIAELNALGV